MIKHGYFFVEKNTEMLFDFMMKQLNSIRMLLIYIFIAVAVIKNSEMT